MSAHRDAPESPTGDRPEDSAPDTRSVESEITIEAPVDAVWKALTDAEELTRWFPLKARVTPGPGGSVWMSWTNFLDENAPIEVWEPGRHLRTGAVPGSAAQIATDFRIEGRGGSTVLRVVSSGFGIGEEWDELYGAWTRGWDFELRGLRHYLERHPGSPRRVAHARARYDCGDTEAWQRLMTPGGFFGPDGLSDLVAGAPYAAGGSVQVIAGRDLSGIVHLWQPPHQLSGTVTAWNDGLLRAELCEGWITVWLSTYGVAEGDVQALESAWAERLGALF